MNLQFGQASKQTTAFQAVHVSHRPFDEVLTSLREGISEAGLKLLHEIDVQGALRGVDQAIGGGRLLFFFHPALVMKLLQIDWSAIVEAPLKLAVFEMPDGGVCLRMADPEVAFARYGNPELAAFGRDIAARCRALLVSL